MPVCGRPAGSFAVLRMTLRGWGIILAGLLPTLSPAAGAIERGITFARVGDTELKLDLHRPDGPAAGVIVWVHGGAWRSGTREGVDLKGLTALG